MNDTATAPFRPVTCHSAILADCSPCNYDSIHVTGSLPIRRGLTGRSKHVTTCRRRVTTLGRVSHNHRICTHPLSVLSVDWKTFRGPYLMSERTIRMPDKEGWRRRRDLRTFTAVPRSTQPCIPPRSLNRVPASAGECHLCRVAGNTV